MTNRLDKAFVALRMKERKRPNKTLQNRRKFKTHDNPTKNYRFKFTPEETLARAQESRRERLANPTPAETAFSELLRQQGVAFQREAIFINGDRFILADFHLAQHKIVFEIDGKSHLGQLGYDRGRDKWLEATHGIKTIRIKNEAIFRKPDEVRKLIESEVYLTIGGPRGE